MKRRSTPSSDETYGRDQARRILSGSELCVTVIATTEEGTTAALNAAKWLAGDLDARITLLKIEVMRIRLPLYRPPLSLIFSINQQHSLVRRSDAGEEDVNIQIRLCRDFDSGLQGVLRRRALVVIGGRRHWWLRREERLERALLRLGHHVIFIDVGGKTKQTSQSNSLPIFVGSGAGQFRMREGAAELFSERESTQ